MSVAVGVPGLAPIVRVPAKPLPVKTVHTVAAAILPFGQGFFINGLTAIGFNSAVQDSQVFETTLIQGECAYGCGGDTFWSVCKGLFTPEKLNSYRKGLFTPETNWNVSRIEQMNCH